MNETKTKTKKQTLLRKRMKCIDQAIDIINNDSEQMRIDIETIYDRQRVTPLINKNKEVVEELRKIYKESAKEI